MPICIECRYPVRTLYTEFAGADDKSSGLGVRLTVCKNCGRFCDKYVEHDFVVLFIDLVLIKPQVYRHLLHNSLMRADDRFDRSIIRLGVLLLLFDVYLTWARIEKAFPAPTNPPNTSSPNPTFTHLAEQPIILQYLFYLLLCASSTLAFHLTIRFLTSSRYSPLPFLRLLPFYSTSKPSPNASNTNTTTTPHTQPYPPQPPSHRPTSVSTALLVSSSTKLFPILMVIWDYDVPASARSLGWAVVANNIEALRILLDCGYVTAAILASVGALARWIVGMGILWAVGIGSVEGGLMKGLDLNLDLAGEGELSGWMRGLWEVGKNWGGRMAFGVA